MFEFVQHLVDALAHLEDVLRLLLVRRHEGGAFAIVPAEIGRFLGRPAHLRHVADAHDVAAEIADHRAADFLQVVIAAGRLQVEAPRACVNGAAGQLGCFRADGVRDRRHRNAKGGETAEIERDAHFRLRQRPDIGIAHAGHAVDFVGQIVGKVFQHAVRRRFRYQRHLHDVGE